MQRETVLNTAKKLITGDRQQTYGDAHKSFARIARLWSEILDVQVKPHEVALCMVALKVSRATTSMTDDTLIDIAGYAALAAEVYEDEQKLRSGGAIITEPDHEDFGR